MHSSVCATIWFYHHLSYNLGLPFVMDVLKSLVQPLIGGAGGTSVVDGMKLVVSGGTVETARIVSSSAWYVCRCTPFLSCSLSSSPCPTLSTVSSPFPSFVVICTHDCPTQHSFSPHPYDWLMLWLSRRPEWQRSREFETITRTTTPGLSGSRATDNFFGDEEEDENSLPGMVKTRVVFQPHRVQIYFADSHGSWRWTESRHKHPMSSIVLNPGVKEMLLNDTRDFLKSVKVGS